MSHALTLNEIREKEIKALTNYLKNNTNEKIQNIFRHLLFQSSLQQSASNMKF